MKGRRGARIVGSLAAAIAVLGCTPGDDTAAERDALRTTAVYGSVLDWVMADESATDAERGPDRVLFVATRSEELIGIDVQASVIELLDDRATVRFIDDRSEAVDESLDGQPVRDDGLLVGLGGVPPDGDRVEVYVDRYRSVDDVVAWDFTVRRDDDSWSIVGKPAPAEVRPLPAP